MKRNYLTLIKKEINRTTIFILIKSLDLLGWSGSASVIRANVLKLAGFDIGKQTKIMTGLNLHQVQAFFSVGENTFINKNVFFDVSSSPVKIGNHCDIGFGTTFSNSVHELKSNFKTRRAIIDSKPIVVEDFVWIGCNATILGGVTIGKGSVVAAGSVVTNDVQENTMVAGIPAKVIKSL